MTTNEQKTQNAATADINDTENTNCGPAGNNGPGNGPDNLADGADPETDNGSEGFTPPSPEEEALLWKDKYMRLSAEFDNYRKRTLREKMDLVESGGSDVIKSLLPVLDDMDRALDQMRKTDDVEAVRSGIELIHTKLCDTLKQKGLAEIEAVGQKLDTDYHEAVAKFPAPDKKLKGSVIDIAQKGYTLKDKVLRHCKVVVGE